MRLFVVLFLFIWRRFWLRYVVLLNIGGFIYLAGLGQIDEANLYKDGSQSANVETLTSENLKYDYLTLTGLNDSYYSFRYFSETATDEQVDKDKQIVLFYTLQTPEELDASLAGKQSHAAVIVRQVLPEEKRACVEDDSCLEGGEMTLEGRLSKTIAYASDQGAIDMLVKNGLYSVDENTLYFDASWQPVTSSTATITKNVGLGWMLVTALLLLLNVFSRRKKQMATNLSPDDPAATESSAPDSFQKQKVQHSVVIDAGLPGRE
jgi:hypothetical protein